MSALLEHSKRVKYRKEERNAVEYDTSKQLWESDCATPLVSKNSAFFFYKVQVDYKMAHLFID